jgi:broad specificity phosphatase PhoE
MPVSRALRRLVRACSVIALLSPAASAASQDGVTVMGWGATRTFSAVALDSLSVDTAWVTPRGQAAEAHVGVALDRLLGAVGVSEEDLRNGSGTHYAFIEARDGYRVVLGFGEVDPRVTGHRVVLVRGSGDQAGTWRLIVPSEVRGPRWARDVIRIDIRSLAAPADGSRLVILVRHAEKADEPRADPPLTEAGRARAVALLAATEWAEIGAIILTPFARTRETAEPVAQARSLVPTEVPVGRSLAAHVAAVTDAVHARPAGTATLVVGHSNTIPSIVTALGGPRLPDLCDSQHSVLYLMVVPSEGPARLVTASYGAADPPVAGCPAMR